MVVVAGLLCRAGGEVLIQRRSNNVPCPGMWEFPGGKVEDGESKAAALQREWDEELGLKITVLSHLHCAIVPFEYGVLPIHLYAITTPLGVGISSSLEVRWTKLVEAVKDRPMTPSSYLFLPAVNAHLELITNR